MAVLIVTRSFRELIFPSISIEVFIILITTLLGLKRFVRFDKSIDYLWLSMPVIYLVNHDSNYQMLFIIIAICGFFARYILRKQVETINIVLTIVLIFSIITSIITWISIINQNIYVNYFVPFLDSSSRNEILRELNQGNLCGFTTHYSRNAFYVLSGILIVVSKLWARVEKNNTKLLYFLLFFETATLFAIGKRGHLLFGIASLYIVYMIMQKNAYKKIQKTIKFIILFIILGLVLFYLFPASRHTFERFLFESESGDISTGRFVNYGIAFEIFLNNPIFGIGIGGFRKITNNVYAGVHNDYLQFLCETGLVGFICFVGLQIYSLYEVASLLKKTCFYELKDRNLQYLLIWATLFQVFVLLYALTGLPHFDYEVNTLYLISCAVPTGIIYRLKGAAR